MILDKELSAMVRDPEYADKTGAEILAAHKAKLNEIFGDEEYEDTRIKLLLLVGVMLIAALGVLLWVA